MNKKNTFIFTMVTFFILIVSFGRCSLFVLDESKQAIVTEFGRLVKTCIDPGVYFKVPFIQEVHFEKRVLNSDVSEVELTLGDQKRLIVDVFARYYISNPVLFFKSVYDVESASRRLKLIIMGDIRDILGKVSLQDLLTNKRAEIVSKIHKRVAKAVQVFGIGMMEVRIKKALLPSENYDAIFDRMRSDRTKEAQEWRGKAEEIYKTIVSEADLKASSIVENAKKQSEIIRGESDAKAIKLLQSAYRKDSKFSKFMLQLKSYEEVLDDKVGYYLSSKHPYFDLLNKYRGDSEHS